jgi:hypothetical protein
MKRKRARSGGVRNPVRNAVLYGFISLLGIVLVVLDVADLAEPPLLMWGLFPALLGPLFFIHYVRTIQVFRDIESGRTAIARWTVPAEQFDRFREEERCIPSSSIMTNFYKPPQRTPAEGVEVIFAENGVLIGGGYFPLSITGGRRLEGVRYVDSSPPSIEFSTAMTAMARTSSTTIDSSRMVQKLRIPVATEATRDADEVVRRYQGIIYQR